MKMPDPDPAKLADFKALVNNLTNVLENIWYKSPNPQELMFSCLLLVYEAITETDAPCPALAAILQLVPPQRIMEAARALVFAPGATRAGLTITLHTLCEWLPVWPQATHLSHWVTSLVDALCQDGKTDVVSGVASNVIIKLVSVLYLPFLRPGALDAAQCLIHYADSEIIKICITEKMPALINHLKRENSASSSKCIQWLLAVKQIGPEFAIPGKVGLANLGNTCYMNSVLQALFMSSQFCADVLSEVCGGSRPVLCRLQELFALLRHSRRPAVAPRALMNASRPPTFSPGDQQDSSEFLIYLLDKLHEEENASISVQQSEDKVAVELTDCGSAEKPRSRSLSASSNSTADEGTSLHRSRSRSADGVSAFPVPTKRSRNLSKFRSIARKSFGGKIQTVFCCHTCFSESVNTDPFLDIQLSFPPSRSADLRIQDLVDFYFKAEKLDGENRYKCDKCRRLCDALRSLRVLEPPANLIVTVKHFASNPPLKLLRNLHYTECITLPGGLEYFLYAAVVHSGYSLHSGHYFTYARDVSSTWHIYDDEMVYTTTLEELTKCCVPRTPYVLFYSRCLPPAVAVPPLSVLQTHLRALVDKDNAEYTQGQRDEEERRRRRKHHVHFSEHRRDDNDDNNPPSNCGGGKGSGMPAIRYTY